MNKTPRENTRIVVFEQQGSGRAKIHGIREFGRNIEITAVYDISADLPELVDEPEEYIVDTFSADLVLDFLKHPDLSYYLADLCRQKKIPLIASGKKPGAAITPFTCCGLGRLSGLGYYGEQFGLPEFSVVLEQGRIRSLKVVRGAPCGATWDVVEQVTGLEAETALTTLPREVQYLCSADPGNFDPISGKSQLHYAGDVHVAALEKALAATGKKKP